MNKLHVISYSDYEEADYQRVQTAKSIIAGCGGVIVRVTAEEDEAEAVIAFRATDAAFAEVKAKLCTEDEGWEVER